MMAGGADLEALSHELESATRADSDEAAALREAAQKMQEDAGGGG